MRNLLRILIFLLPIWVTAQTNTDCYKLRFDMSGNTDTSGVGLLKQNACRLQNELPSNEQSKFQVQDAGFYMMTEFLKSTSGNPYLDQFEELKTIVAQEKEYYILVGRQTDSKGIYTKFYVDVNLPNVTANNCPNDFNKFAKTFLINKIEEEYNSNGRNYDKANRSIANGLGALANYIKDVKECCQQPNVDVTKCLNCKNVDNIASYLGSLGFSKTSIQNIGNYPNNPALRPEVEDKAKLLFTVNNLTAVDIPSLYSNTIDTFKLKGLIVKVLITTNADLCSPDWDKMLQDAQSGDYNVFYWHHIHRAKQTGGHLLFTNVFYPKAKKSAKGTRAGPDPVSVFMGAAAGALVDVMVQTFTHYFGDDDIHWSEFGKAFDRVNWYSVAGETVISGAQSFVGFFPINKNTLVYGGAAASATAAITANYYSGKYDNSPNWKTDMSYDFGVSFGSSLLGVKIGEATTIMRP